MCCDGYCAPSRAIRRRSTASRREETRLWRAKLFRLVTDKCSALSKCALLPPPTGERLCGLCVLRSRGNASAYSIAPRDSSGSVLRVANTGDGDDSLWCLYYSCCRGRKALPRNVHRTPYAHSAVYTDLKPYTLYGRSTAVSLCRLDMMAITRITLT